MVFILEAFNPEIAIPKFIILEVSCPEAAGLETAHPSFSVHFEEVFKVYCLFKSAHQCFQSPQFTEHVFDHPGALGALFDLPEQKWCIPDHQKAAPHSHDAAADFHHLPGEEDEDPSSRGVSAAVLHCSV